MRIPNILRELLPAERLKPILDLANQDKIAAVLKEVAEQIGWKGTISQETSPAKSFPPKDLQQAIKQARWWFDILSHRFQSASLVPLQQGLNATGQIFSSRWIATPASTDTVTAMSMVHSGFCVSQGLTDSLNDKLCQLTGAEACLVVTNVESAILLLSARLSSKPWAISRGDCVRLPSGCDVVELLNTLNTVGVIEVGASNDCRQEDYVRAVAQGAGGIFRVASNDRDLLMSKENSDIGNANDNQHVPTAVLTMAAMLQDFSELPADSDSEKIRAADQKSFQQLYQTPSLQSLIHGGADIVVCPGNGWIGGPVCGIILGNTANIECLQRTANRLGLKAAPSTLAGLRAALESCTTWSSWRSTPVGQIATNSLENLEHRAKKLATQLEGVSTISDLRSELRSLPVGPSMWESSMLDSYCLIITPTKRNATEWQKQLSTRPVPVETLVVAGQLVVVLRTINPADDQELVSALSEDF